MRIGILLALLCSFNLFAKELNLVKITADKDPYPSIMYVVLNEASDIVEFGKKDLDKAGKVTKRTLFSTELDINGVVLKKKKGRKILVMRGHNIGPVYGGGLELDYLYNGITRRRKSFHMTLHREGDEWSVIAKDKKISHLHFKIHRKRFVGVIGIKKVIIKK